MARFLNPLAKTQNQTSPSKLIENPNPHLNFKGWNNHSPSRWPEWVDQMAGKYSSVWIKAGILDSILNSMYEVSCNPDLVSSLIKFWSPKTNTFVFSWGEATISLEDVMILGGFSVLGECVDRCVLSEDVLKKKVEEINQVRAGLVSSKAKKATYSQWINIFMGSENENEHVAFLSMWLSMFVFPQTRDSIGKHVIEIAVVLSQGVKLDLASAVLASIYSNLTLLKEQDVDSSNCINLFGIFQLVQVWVYERFPVLGPKTPNQLSPGEPRLARWHNLNTNVCLNLMSLYMRNGDTFIWRPYVVDLKNWGHQLYYQDNEEVISYSSSLDDDLLSFIRFIHPCELNGLNCKVAYLCHRVAMQFGYDQDIPYDMCSYKLVKDMKVFVPSRLFQPGVSKSYYDWWFNVDREDCGSDREARDNKQEHHKRRKLEDRFAEHGNNINNPIEID